MDFDITPFLPAITGAIGGAASAGVFKGPIQTLEDWWYINFGHSQSEKANLLRAQHEANVEALKKQMLKDVSEISPENIVEPKLNILGPALEASKYYIEEESLRNMFSKLISASMDKSKVEFTRSSFVEIIKQLEPIDAQNLTYILDSTNPLADLICNYKINFSSGGYQTFFTNVYLGNPQNKEQRSLSASLENLARLGLIVLSNHEFRNKDGVYKPFEESEYYQKTVNEINELQAAVQSGKKFDPLNPKYNLSITGPEIEKGLIIVTNLGNIFCSICLN